MFQFLVLAATAAVFEWQGCSGSEVILSRSLRHSPKCQFMCVAGANCTENATRCGTNLDCHYTSDDILSDCDCGLADKYEYLIPGRAEDASRSASPWHVGIYQIITSTVYRHICTGVLIFRDVVLTTAYCMYDSQTFRQFDPSDIKVAAKQTRDYFLEDAGQQKFDVATIRILDGYEGDYTSFSRNLAIIFLKKPASRPGIHPICLYTKKELPSDWQYVKLTGWGILPLSNYSRTKNVKHARLNYMDVWTCLGKHGRPLNRNLLTSDKFCMEFTDDANMSDEDSGGPCCIYWKGRHYLVGILSNKLKYDTHFGIATQLYRYLPWIEHQVKTIRQELTCERISNHFHCGDNLGCVPLGAICDGIMDCPNGHDEEESQCNIGGADRCMVPDGVEIYKPTVCNDGNGCKATRYVQHGTEYNVSCPQMYRFAEGSQPVVTILCYKGSWRPEPPSCHRQCSAVTSTTLDFSCTYQGNEVNCNYLLQPNTSVEFKCKQAYKKEGGAFYRSPTKCREDGQLIHQLTDCIPECGVMNAAKDVVPQISLGKPAGEGSFPWIAAIYWREKNSGGKYAHKCGGTIIATNKVLTAAHCLFERQDKMIDVEDLAVATGKYNRLFAFKDSFDQRFKVKKTIIGPHYNGVLGNYGQDIAALILSNHIVLNAFNVPACLDLNNAFGGIPSKQIGYVAGWGNTEDGKQPVTLMETVLGYLDIDDCRDRFTLDYTKWVTPDKFCVIYFNGSGTQAGDSGGGLTFIHDGLHYLYGIVSIKHKDSNEFAAFTNVQAHTQWLKNVLALQD